MIEYITLGSTPCDEECAQVGQEDYSSRAKKECRAYINQLWRVLKSKGVNVAPPSFDLVIKNNPHDFGSYAEVNCKFDSDNAEACDLAYELDACAPANWDDEARKELGLDDKEIDEDALP